jgi:long-chain fatty acid transport protein
MRTMTKKILFTGLAAVLVLPSFAPANGFNVSGLGSRAQGMGGAYVSLANDFTAVFWNPAGAAGLKQTTFGFFTMDIIPTNTYTFSPEIAIPEFQDVDAKTKTSHYLGLLAGFYVPVSSNVVLGLGVSTPSLYGTKWTGDDFTGLSNGTSYIWMSKVETLTLSPMVAVRLGEAVSVGAAINFNHGIFNLKKPAGTSAYPPQIDAPLAAGLADLGQYEEAMNGWGFGVTFGLLVKPVEDLSVGLTVRTSSALSFKGSALLSYASLYGIPDTSGLVRDMPEPLWVAGGVSFRPLERLLLSADVHWTQWSKLDQLTTDYLDPIWADLAAVDGRDVLVLDWQDTTQIRFGLEYTLNPTTALRAGYYHDPAPGPTSTLNVLLPTHTFEAFSVGVGKSLGDIQLDFGLEYMAGNTRTAPDTPDSMPGTYGAKMVVPTISVTYRF